MEEGIKEATRFIAREAPKFAEALGAAKFTTKDKEITIEGQGGADVVTDLGKTIFGRSAGAVPDPAPDPLGKKRALPN
jgi:hypothetical protein